MYNRISIRIQQSSAGPPNHLRNKIIKIKQTNEQNNNNRKGRKKINIIKRNPSKNGKKLLKKL